MYPDPDPDPDVTTGSLLWGQSTEYKFGLHPNKFRNVSLFLNLSFSIPFTSFCIYIMHISIIIYLTISI